MSKPHAGRTQPAGSPAYAFGRAAFAALLAGLWAFGAADFAAVAEPLTRPDLDVTFIERVPRYVPGPWVYPATGPQFLGAGEKVFTQENLREKHKQWPVEGEQVTFTAHVSNKSDTAAPAASFAWYLDAKKVASGTLPAVEPWQEVTQLHRWRWRSGAHTVRFEVDGEGAVEEICERNNSLDDRTDALSLQMRVTPELYGAWRTKPNALGSYSFEDWVQRHVTIMNGVLAGSAYPKTAPDGILERVRVDGFTVMTKEAMQAEPPQRAGYDGGWNFYDDNLGKANSWFDFHIQDDFISRIDTGLLHELTHQLGIIDMYCIVVGPAWNHVRDDDGDLLLLGYHTRYPGMMGGGSLPVDFDGTPVPPRLFTAEADGNVTVSEHGTFAAYSEETAGALNALRGLRRGHFGLYLFDLPAQSFLRILDNQGRPVAGASITAYQQSPYPGPQSIPDRPVYGGETDADGLFALGSAPFSNVNCVGLNGVLFFVISARGHTEYRFLDVCTFNIAAWRGHDKSWTAVFKTAIPPEGAPQPPHDLRWGLLGPNVKPVLRWEPSPSSGVAAYNVYRRSAADGAATFDAPYVKVATVPADRTSCEVEPPSGSGNAGGSDRPWFTVTAVDDGGRESGYAKNKELIRWGPWGTATLERDDPETVTVTLLPGPGWVQAHSVFVVGPRTRLALRVQTESRRSAALRLSVAGLGEVDVPLSTLAPAGSDLADGQWHELSVDLRALLDRVAAERNVTPAQARTTWNEDWLVTACRFGDWSNDGQEQAVFCFQGLHVSEGR
jgi:hypothetical protein